MIVIKQLTKTYNGKVHALRGIDLEIGGGMFGLVGPNGAGKTTLIGPRPGRSRTSCRSRWAAAMRASSTLAEAPELRHRAAAAPS